jgi:hypothetical protein
MVDQIGCFAPAVNGATFGSKYRKESSGGASGLSVTDWKGRRRLELRGGSASVTQIGSRDRRDLFIGRRPKASQYLTTARLSVTVVRMIGGRFKEPARHQLGRRMSGVFVRWMSPRLLRLDHRRLRHQRLGERQRLDVSTIQRALRYPPRPAGQTEWRKELLMLVDSMETAYPLEAGRAPALPSLLWITKK